MDQITRSRAQLARCRRQIEQSHEIIAVSMRWLKAHQDSVKRELDNPHGSLVGAAIPLARVITGAAD
jgi:hypothetical protein